VQCRLCVNACRKPAHLLPDEDYWIARFLNIPREQLLKEKLEEKFVAVIGVGEQKLVLTGLRPKIENGWCVFFKDGLCTIHPYKPFGCKYASCKTTETEVKEMLDWLTKKWYYHNLIHNKLEVFDKNNNKQQEEIIQELNYVIKPIK